MVRLFYYGSVRLLWGTIWLLDYSHVNLTGLYMFLSGLIVGYLQLCANCECVNDSNILSMCVVTSGKLSANTFSMHITCKFLKWTAMKHYLQNGIVNVNYAYDFSMSLGSGELRLFWSVFPLPINWCTGKWNVNRYILKKLMLHTKFVYRPC